MNLNFDISLIIPIFVKIKLWKNLKIVMLDLLY